MFTIFYLLFICIVEKVNKPKSTHFIYISSSLFYYLLGITHGIVASEFLFLFYLIKFLVKLHFKVLYSTMIEQILKFFFFNLLI